MEWLLILMALLLSAGGLIGCFLPGIPGPPLNYIGILLIHAAFSPFTNTFLVIWAIVTLLVVIADYYLPVIIARKYGATRYGIIGSIIGLLAGLAIPPIGMVIGLIAGAVIGDMLAGKNLQQSVRSGFGSALGTLFSTGGKLIVSGILTWFVVVEIIAHFW